MVTRRTSSSGPCSPSDDRRGGSVALRLLRRSFLTWTRALREVQQLHREPDVFLADGFPVRRSQRAGIDVVGGPDEFVFHALVCARRLGNLRWGRGFGSRLAEEGSHGLPIVAEA